MKFFFNFFFFFKTDFFFFIYKQPRERRKKRETNTYMKIHQGIVRIMVNNSSATMGSDFIFFNEKKK